jgi:hypothetical protein
MTGTKLTKMRRTNSKTCPSVDSPKRALNIHLTELEQYYEGKRDVILFAIDCSPSMFDLCDDPDREGEKTCHLLVALNAAVQIQKKKAIVGPNDSVGIMLFNTVRHISRCLHIAVR